ncbi:plasmid pRiA4b ORF-3 family protein [Agromyces archimandritae]|uniref:Plasmid pRiA4b ORF-3 family protein n=1 Tax=Agromyces archimandritae TaxID=2781962 RepID=A0A975FNF5_9MICO|nr:plasmid pRiA4b ORF-3 family protein [Agromyces archimandritae]QTX05640.1 plasmid pRiA4b ORF-3 family protein [Agromyces archimandritae]
MNTHERLRLRVSLDAVEPEIWRLLDIDGSLTLEELHDVLQAVMGWRDAHLHEFHDDDRSEAAFMSRRSHMDEGPVRSWVPPEEFEEARAAAANPFPGARPLTVVDESTVTVADVFDTLDGPLGYSYDFGDGWLLTLELIERAPADEPGLSPWRRRAELVRGERRGPLEDSGGPHGYEGLIDRLQDPVTVGEPDWEEFHDAVLWSEDIAWPAGGFDPDAFDAEAVDRELALRFDVASDTSGLIAADEQPAVDAGAAVVRLLDALMPPYARELRIRMRASGALDPTVDAPSPEAVRTAVQPFRWLLDAVGSDGIQLSKAGWMPPAVVRTGMDEIPAFAGWIGTGNREDNTVPMRALRETARHLGLVRVFKGRLMRTPAARAIGTDDAALLTHLARRTALGATRPAEEDAIELYAVELACGDRRSRNREVDSAHRFSRLRVGDASDETAQLRAIASGLEALEWANRDGSPLLPRDALGLLGGVHEVFASLGFRARLDPLMSADDERAVLRAFGRAVLGVGDLA